MDNPSENVPSELNTVETLPRPVSVKRGRGRPKLNVDWPEGQFTFINLENKNVLSSSSLRKKIRAELKGGGVLKVGTLKTAFGRPQNVYKKSLG